jgi:hypothetical protein
MTSFSAAIPAAIFVPGWNIPGRQQDDYSLTHHFWSANDLKIALRVEAAKGMTGHIWTPAFLTRQESSALIRRFWGTPSPWIRKF